jgi:hypothetical protein
VLIAYKRLAYERLAYERLALGFMPIVRVPVRVLATEPHV